MSIGSIRVIEGLASSGSSFPGHVLMVLHHLRNIMIVDSGITFQATFVFRTAPKMITILAKYIIY